MELVFGCDAPESLAPSLHSQKHLHAAALLLGRTHHPSAPATPTRARESRPAVAARRSPTPAVARRAWSAVRPSPVVAFVNVRFSTALADARTLPRAPLHLCPRTAPAALSATRQQHPLAATLPRDAKQRSLAPARVTRGLCATPPAAGSRLSRAQAAPLHIPCRRAASPAPSSTHARGQPHCPLSASSLRGSPVREPPPYATHLRSSSLSIPPEPLFANLSIPKPQPAAPPATLALTGPGRPSRPLGATDWSHQPSHTAASALSHAYAWAPPPPPTRGEDRAALHRSRHRCPP
ncbi:hypothetical protein Taro_043690 [Colocasia esculenta]|uniref:Uncharacterized protein n=1 Tax=Colocasia esculenta TaxID=4460 RepID=A0A843WK17_COLES|nr:hypothetical protein [Colocasia esculenta]